jgi:hypothetical protein
MIWVASSLRRSFVSIKIPLVLVRSLLRSLSPRY